MKVLDFRGVSWSWLEDFRRGLSTTTENTLAFCQLADRAVVMGARAIELERVHSDYCKANGIPVIRSVLPHGETGYSDSGEFRVCAAINNTSGYAISSTNMGRRYLSKVIIAALNFLNINADWEGCNIFVSGKKIGAVTAYQFSDVILLKSHVFLDWDIDTAEKAIISPKHDMRERIRTLKQLGKDVSFDELKDAVKQAFQQVFGITLEGELPNKELVDGIKASIEGLHPKYASETWLKYGKWSPVKDYWRPE
ncbi:hypothetical protein ES703_22306 [subsurface metagenome]